MTWKWAALSALLLVIYGVLLGLLEARALAFVYCGLLAIAGLGYSLRNFRRREQVTKALQDLDAFQAFTEVDVRWHKQGLVGRAEEGIFEGLMLSSFSAILACFIEPIVEIASIGH
ncbi:MAG TPA: hypothetical protein VK614_14640 [Allosphingosinicella sp.]|nr:hypothetical protein [Allosphingosinicella sp.]